MSFTNYSRAWSSFKYHHARATDMTETLANLNTQRTAKGKGTLLFSPVPAYFGRITASEIVVLRQAAKDLVRYGSSDEFLWSRPPEDSYSAKGSQVRARQIAEFRQVADDSHNNARCAGECTDACKNNCSIVCYTTASSGCGDCESHCSSGCDQACSVDGGCGSACSATLHWWCATDCKSNCTSGCKNGCDPNCHADCQSYCYTSCLGGCASSCSNCQSSCYNSCTSGCTYGCTTSQRVGTDPGSL